MNLFVEKIYIKMLLGVYKDRFPDRPITFKEILKHYGIKRVRATAIKNSLQSLLRKIRNKILR